MALDPDWDHEITLVRRSSKGSGCGIVILVRGSGLSKEDLVLFRELESMMAASPISARNGRWIEAARYSRDRAATAPNWARALLLLAPLTLGLACVDLTPPKELVAYLAGD